jgi:hypothetical protein
MAVVHLIRERREDGWSYWMIADALNTDRVRTKNSGKWYAQTVKNILVNGLYQKVVEASDPHIHPISAIPPGLAPIPHISFEIGPGDR